MYSSINAAPMVIPLGIDDRSAATPLVSREALPTHLNKAYIFAKTGPTEPQLLDGVGMAQMYGAETFDPKGPFAKHTTALANTIAAQANPQMIERLVPLDAGIKSNVTLWLDVLTTDVPVYLRSVDGSLVLDEFNEPIADGPAVPGFKVKWVITNDIARQSAELTYTSDVADSVIFKQKLVGPGDQTDGSNTSVRYPIAQAWGNFHGADGDNTGLRIYAPTTKSSNPVNSQLLTRLKAYPFRMQTVRRRDAYSTARPKSMMNGDQELEFVLPRDMINPFTNTEASLADLFPEAWQRLDNPGFNPMYGDIGQLYIYEEFLAEALGYLYDAEQTYLTANPAKITGSDLSVGATDGVNLINIFGLTSSKNIPYHTIVHNKTDPNSVVLTESTNIMLSGGSDGTMDLATLDLMVIDRMADYIDPLANVQNRAVHVESIMYDSGFGLNAKLALAQFIGLRKDTFVWLSTYTVGGPVLTKGQESAMAVTLNTRLRLFPESSWFGTGVVRGGVMARYAPIKSSGFKGMFPATFEIAMKSARMMGAANGIWKKTYLFDSGEYAKLELLGNLSDSFVPAQQRTVDWANGLNYPIDFSRSQRFFPAIRTVFGDDTSVLTGYFTAMACVELQKVGDRVWAMFTGNQSLTEQQLCEKVEAEVIKQTSGRFAGMFRIVPKCVITESDAKLGYKWTLAIKIGASNMKTVMTLSVQSYRIDDPALA